jgi:hypothetical protein
VLYYKTFAWPNMSTEDSLDTRYVFKTRSSAILTLNRTPAINIICHPLITCPEHTIARTVSLQTTPTHSHVHTHIREMVGKRVGGSGDCRAGLGIHAGYAVLQCEPQLSSLPEQQRPTKDVHISTFGTFPK